MQILRRSAIAIALSLVGILPASVAVRSANIGSDLLLGAVLPLTGPYAEYGTVPHDAIELAIEEREKSDFPYKVTVQYEDSQLKPSLALTAIRKLIDVNHVPVVFGAAGSNETEVVGPIAQRNHVVLISPSSTAASLSKIGDYFFRTIPSDAYEGNFMAQFVYHRGIHNIAVFAVNDTGTRSLADAFGANFVRLGGKVLGKVLAPKDTNDVRTQISAIRAMAPAAVFAVGYANETGVFLRQARELGLNLQIYSAHPAGAPEVRQIAGPAADGLIFSTPADSHNSPAAMRFNTAFRAKYGHEPGEFAPEAYDAAMLVLDALQKAGPTATAIRDYLHQVRNYNGASGEITFSPTGDVDKPITVMTIRDGKVVPFGGNAQ